MTEDNTDSLPQALKKPSVPSRGIPGLVIWIALIAVLISGTVTYLSMKQEGLEIKIVLPDGAGLKVGDSLRHRGVSVGTVTSIRLTSNLDSVDVVARLNPEASLVASQGTRFWVVRPEATVRGIGGLDTILSGQYIAVDPSRRRAEPELEFVGLASPPATELPGDALEVVLEAKSLSGLQPSAPILYRGMEVGRVQSIGLSPDSRWVRIAASIKADYRSLIRDNTRFWNVSGVKMDMGFRGIALQAQTLSSIAVGGVEFATPEPPGKAVVIGHRFELFEKPEDEWLEWQTPIPAGAASRLELDILPPLQLAALSWKTSFYGFKSSHQTVGWVLPLDDGSLVGPADLFRVPADAVAGSVTFDCAGKSWPIGEVKVEAPKTAAVVRAKVADFPRDRGGWPSERLSTPDFSAIGEDEILLLCEGDQRYIPLEMSSLRFTKDGIFVQDIMNLPKPLHGAAIVRVSSKSVVGVLVADPESDQAAIKSITVAK